jgi:hypothetical protein
VVVVLETRMEMGILDKARDTIPASNDPLQARPNRNSKG